MLKPNQNKKIRFIDLFAGIGGFRLALESIGGECVFSSEWDENAKKTYEMNFGEKPHGDITKIKAKDVPDHDILCAGFPCQPFSLAGVSARVALNRNHGFECETQGNLFFDIIRIAKEKKPQVLFLENVKNLINHDKGNTLQVIKNEIEKLGYSFNLKIINANTMVPQSRVRAYMICIKNSKVDFEFPDFEGKPIALKSILEKKVDEKYTISDRLWEGHQRRTSNNLERGTGFTAFEADIEKPSNTIVARYGKDGKECLIPQKGKNPRLLTPLECARLQGFPNSYVLPQSRAIAYKQFGNSVAVPVIAKIADSIITQCF